MKSKISLCNKMLFWKDITRFWPLWTLECVIYLLIGIIPLCSQISSIRELYEKMGNQEAASELMAVCLTQGNILCFTPLIIFWSVVIGVSVFLYLTKEREAYTIHSFPMRRETIFGSHYLAGLAMQVVPMLAAGMIQILIGTANGANVAGVLMLYMLQGLVQILFFYSLACMIVMLVGNAFMSYVIYGVLNVLVAGVLVLCSAVAQCFVYGSGAESGITELLRGRVAQALTPIYAFLRHSGFMRWTVYGDWSMGASSQAVLSTDEDALISVAVQKASGDLKFLAPYLIPVVVFIILAVFLYQKRHLEAAGDMVAFSWGRPVFRIVFVFCASLLFSVFLYTIAFQSTVGDYAFGRAYKIMLILVLLSTVLFYLIANMILDKTFFIWKTTSYWRMVCLVGVMAVGMLFVKNNNFGARIPDRDKIAGASIRLDKSYTGQADILIEEKTQIDRLYKLNQGILKYGRSLNVQRDTPEIDYIDITYSLKGGREFSAYYPVQTECEIMQKAEELVRSQPLCESLFTSDYEHISPTSVMIEQRGGKDAKSKSWNQSNDVSLGKERKRDKIYQAIIKDIEAGNIDINNVLSEDESLYQIDVQFRRKTVSGSQRYQTATLWIAQDCEETLKVLRELKVE